MKIIRDEELFGIAMIPLFVDWGLKRCNQKDCGEKPTTIIRFAPGENPAAPEGIMFALCEEHFQMCNAPEGASLNLKFDDYDAFAKEAS